MKRYLILLLALTLLTASCITSRPTKLKSNEGVVVKIVEGMDAESCAYLVKFPGGSNNRSYYEWFHFHCNLIEVGDELILCYLQELEQEDDDYLFLQ